MRLPVAAAIALSTADAAPETAGGHDDRFDLGHLRDAHRIERVEVRLLDAAVLDGALLAEYRRQPIHERARDLALDLRGVHRVARVGRADDAMDFDLVAAGHRHFRARRNVT